MIASVDVRPLPACAVPLPGESLASLLQRTAATMGYCGVFQLQGLLVDAGPAQGNPDMFASGPLLTYLAELLRRSTLELLGMTCHRYAASLALVPRGSLPSAACDGKTLSKYWLPSLDPVCPRCLAEDVNQRNRDPIVANTIATVGNILACLLPLVLCVYLVMGLRDDPQTDSTLTEILVEEIVAEEPALLPLQRPVAALPRETIQPDDEPAEARADRA